MKEFNTKYKVGFTLVELLVVIGIIGILAGIVYASFGDARKSARDDIRKSDLKSLELALRLYKAQNGRYPEACRGANEWSGNVTGVNACSPIGNVTYIVGLAPDYIATLPMDPKGMSTANNERGYGYIYRVSPSGTDYKLLAYNTVESKFVTSYDDEFARCDKPNDNVSHSNPNYDNLCGSNPPLKIYGVYSAGAANW